MLIPQLLRRIRTLPQTCPTARRVLKRAPPCVACRRPGSALPPSDHTRRSLILIVAESHPDCRAAVTRAKSNMKAKRRYSRPVDRTTGLICDQTIVLTGFYTRQGFDRPLRRVKFNDPETRKSLVFLTNNFALPALTIARLYKYRWQVELFFKWIKQHLRIKAVFGTSENAVKAQIWSAVCVYVLVAIVKKRLAVKASLYEMLQILSLTLFEKTQLLQLFSGIPQRMSSVDSANQLNLFD